MVYPDGLLTIIARNAAQENADTHGDAHGHKSYGKRYPCALEHARKDIPSQVIGPQQVYAQGRHFFGLQGVPLGLGKRRAQFFLQSHPGGVQGGVGARGDGQAHDGRDEKEDKDHQTAEGHAISAKPMPGVDPRGARRRHAAFVHGGALRRGGRVGHGDTILTV